MAVEMVRRDVEENGDVEHEALGQFELVGAELQHIDAVGAQRFEQQDRHAEIAAGLRLAPGLRQDMADQRGGRRFAVGAGNAGEMRLALGQCQQFDVADDRHAGGARLRRHRMRLRIAVRNARRQHQRPRRCEIGGAEIDDRQPGLSGGVALRRCIVPGHDRGAPPLQRGGGCQAGARQAEHSDLLVAELGDFDHRLTAASAWRARRSPGSKR